MSDGEDEQQPEETEQPEEFQNRAARRAAKHKKHAHGVAEAQNSEQQHGRGTVASRRQQYGNRRTG